MVFYYRPTNDVPAWMAASWCVCRALQIYGEVFQQHPQMSVLKNLEVNVEVRCQQVTGCSTLFDLH